MDGLGCIKQWVYSPNANRCINAILSTEPQSSWEWTYWLSLIERRGTNQQKQEAIAQTSCWLQLHPDDHHVRYQYLALIGQCGKTQHKQEAIAQTGDWLQLHPDDYDVRTQYLALTGQFGTSQKKQEAIAQTSSWLQLHSEDTSVRTQYLALIGQCGTTQQKQEAIAQTSSWLQLHSEDTSVRTQYLALIGQCGTTQQKQEAIAQTTTWLQDYPNYSDVRTIYLVLAGKAGKDIINVEPMIIQQWQWFSQQPRVSQDLWVAFLPVLYHHAPPQLIQEAINLALKQYPDNTSIICLIFAYFRDELDYETCYQLADFLRQSRLPTDKWQNNIHAANFFRDYGELDIAEEIYQGIIKAAEFRMKKYGDALQKTINFALLNYVYLLLLRQPPEPYKAIDYLEPILAENPKHCVAHWYMAKCYQAQGHNPSTKGRKVYQQAIEHFQKAIKFDNQKNGHFWYEFGGFYRDVMQNPTEARTCFENSLNQKIHLPACVDLAELEVADGNVERARELLQQGLALVPITRPEREQRDKLDPRIQAIQSQLDL
jgi:tetratricopeptide (TPR) repeat protein